MKISHLKQLVIAVFALFSLNACDIFERSEYPVVDSGIVVGDESAYWLDNTHMIVRPGNKDSVDKSGKEATEYFPLQIWDIRTNQLTLLPDQNATAADSFSTPCVGDSIIRYSRARKTGVATWDDISFTIPYKSISGKLEFGETTQDKFKGAFDKVNCLYSDEVVLPEWTKQVPKHQITLLKPEHGFLFMDKENYMAVPKGLYLYPPNSTSREGAKDLFPAMNITPIPHETYGYSVDNSNVTYYAFKKAYELRLQNTRVLWWLYPDGHVESGGDWVSTYPDKDNKKILHFRGYIPTAMFPVGANYFNHDTIDDFGLYAYMGDRNNPKRLVKGRVDENLQVSPDGCKVAFLNDDRPYVKDKDEYKLQVIDLCHKGNP